MELVTESMFRARLREVLVDGIRFLKPCERV